METEHVASFPLFCCQLSCQNCSRTGTRFHHVTAAPPSSCRQGELSHRSTVTAGGSGIRGRWEQWERQTVTDPFGLVLRQQVQRVPVRSDAERVSKMASLKQQVLVSFRYRGESAIQQVRLPSHSPTPVTSHPLQPNQEFLLQQHCPHKPKQSVVFYIFMACSLVICHWLTPSVYLQPVLLLAVSSFMLSHAKLLRHNHHAQV